MQNHTSIERNKQTVRRFLEDTHSGRFDVIDDTVTEDIVTHGFPGGANPRSRAEYRAFFAALDAAFPRMRFGIEAMIAESERVAVRFTVAGVHAGPFAGVAATGREVSFGGMVIYRLRDGRIAETWLCPDNLTLLQQLGAFADSRTAA